MRPSRQSESVPPARVDNLIQTETVDELLVYDVASHQIHHLNRITVAIWRQCDGRRTVSEIARLATTESGETVGFDVVHLALGKLDEAGLLAGKLEPGIAGSRQSRRALLRKAAVGGAVALPAIVSITAPQAASALSNCTPGLPEGGNCTQTRCCTYGRTCVEVDAGFWHCQ